VKTKLKLVAAVAALGLLLVACGSNSKGSSSDTTISAGQKATGTPIEVGAITTQSGSQSGVIAVEKQELSGAQAYIDYVNDHGGVDGHPVHVNVQDDGGDPNTALADAKQLVEQVKVPAMMYIGAGPIAAAVIPYLEEQKVPLNSTSASNLSLFQPVNPYVFGQLTPYEYEGAAFADFLVKNKGLKKVAYAGYDDVSGKSWGSTFISRAKEDGAEVTSVDYFKRGETDFTSLIQKYQSDKPDAVAFFAAVQETAAVLKNANSAGFKTTWAWGPGGTNTLLLGLVGPLAKGTYGVSPFDLPNSKTKAMDEFNSIMDTYEPKTERVPYTIYGYVLAKFLVNSLKSTNGNFTPAAVRDAMEKQSGDYGLMAPFTMSPDNHVANTAVKIVQYTDKDLVSASDFIKIDPSSVKPYTG
jgi:ABC-type branched-subunit amino acid transport system substrate-binding protein